MKDRLKEIENRIQAACDRAGRDRREIVLIAVSKTMPTDRIEEAYQLGLRHFGENKVQELTSKEGTLKDVFIEPVHWHLIGHLQRNKVKQVVGLAELIHSVDSLRLAHAIEEEAAKKNIICDVLIEVNIANEASKDGISAEEVNGMVEECIRFPHLRLRGLMTIAPYVDNAEDNRRYFKQMRELFIDIQKKNIDNGSKGNFDQFNILSMGMTGDYEVAVEEGATMIRIGTGLFGTRNSTK